MLLTSLLVGLTGKQLGYKGSQAVAIISTSISVLCSILLLFDIKKETLPSKVNVYN